MADRVDFYFRQRVTEAELDLAFALLEKADRNLSADLNIHGIVSGAVPSAHSPVPNLSVDLTAPARAYDNLGQRIFFGTGQTVDCAVDLVGIPTEVMTQGNERWLGVFLRFKRQLSEPRTDGNSQQVFFRRDESFEFVVRQAPEGSGGFAPRPTFQAEELLVCEVCRRHGQSQIFATDIDTSRRQSFIFAQGTSVAVNTDAWSVLAPLAATAQSSLNEVDAELRDHFTGSGRRHTAQDIGYQPRGFVGAGNVQEAVDEVVDDLTSGTRGNSGATRIGVDAAPGAPHALEGGTVKSQLAALLGLVNSHVGPSTNAHEASAILAAPHNNVTGKNVQAQLQELAGDLLATSGAAPGASLIGIDSIAGSPTYIEAGTLRAALAKLLSALNAHADGGLGVHHANTIAVEDVYNYYEGNNVETVLREIFEPFRNGHFPNTSEHIGEHRTIYQPPLTGTKSMLLDSSASGSPATRLRFYADAESVWFTLNASWNGAAWTRDSAAHACSAFRFSGSEFEFLHENTPTVTFSLWARSWRLPMGGTVNSAFEVRGTVQEVGRCGLKMWNPTSTAGFHILGGSTTFRNRFQANPSSITLFARQTSSIVPATAIDNISRDGFALSIHATFAGGTNCFWFGDYTAIA